MGAYPMRLANLLRLIQLRGDFIDVEFQIVSALRSLTDLTSVRIVCLLARSESGGW